MACEPNPRRALTPELTPLVPYGGWRRVAVRAGQALRFDVRGRRAWQRAAAGPQDGMGGGRAVHLARAGVPRRAPTQWHDDTVNTAWVEALDRNSPASVAAWLLALPVSLAAQRWRNRALWQAARLDAPRVFLTVLRGGADVRSRDDNVSRYHNDKADAPLISFLLKDEEYDDDRAPRRLAKMAMLVERGCGINEGVLRQRRMGRFSPLELRRLRELGMTLDTDRLSVRWLTPLLTDAVGRTPGTLKPLRALLRAEARPNARNDEGDPLLHVLLLLTHRCCEDSGQAEMRALYTALVQAGADPTSTRANGDTPTPQCPPRTLRPPGSRPISSSPWPRPIPERWTDLMAGSEGAFLKKEPRRRRGNPWKRARPPGSTGPGNGRVFRKPHGRRWAPSPPRRRPSSWSGPCPRQKTSPRPSPPRACACRLSHEPPPAGMPP